MSRMTFCSAQPAMCRAFDADAGDLPQAVGLLLDEIEHGLPESPHQPRRIHRADTADQP